MKSFTSILLLGLFLLFGTSCTKKQPRSFYRVDMDESSPIVQDNAYSYRLQNWAKGAIGNFCFNPEHFKGKVTKASAVDIFYEMEDLLCYTVQNRDSAEISAALEYYYYTENNVDISRNGLLNEVSFTIKDMWEVNDSLMYIYLHLYEVGVPFPIIIDTLYLKEYKFHH